ncbi:type IV pilus secretin PilQ [Pandoraea sp. NPDC087047]|uniref:type IV pilus secretin PilQ n=1 Tax=Pandoraea sp. NPDC087047 TaxID=3364390 RepID=UPI00380606EF
MQKDLVIERQSLDRANEAARRLPVLMTRLHEAEAETIAWQRLLPMAAPRKRDDTGAPVQGVSTTANAGEAKVANVAEEAVEAEEEHATWRADLESLVLRTGLMLEFARPGPSASSGEVEIERAEIRVRGTVANLLGWLAEIDRVPRHLTVEHLSLQGPRMGAGSADSAMTEAGDIEGTLTVTVAAYRWQRAGELPSQDNLRDASDGSHASNVFDTSSASIVRTWPVLPEPAPQWRMPADTIDVFRAPLTRRSAQDAVTMTASATQAPVDDARPVGSMRAGLRYVVLRRTSAQGLTATWNEGPPGRAKVRESGRAPTVDVTLHGVEAADALRAFARLTGRSVVIGERVSGRLDMEVQGVSAATAFDVMIRSAGLGVQSVNGVDWIAPRADLLADEQTQLEAAAKREALLPLSGRRFTLNYPRALALREIILGEKDSKGQRLLSPRGSLIADPRTNQLFVTDLPEKLEALASFIARIDVPVRQVLIEARIVEADDRFSESLGVRLAGYNSRADGGRGDGKRPGTRDEGGIGGATGVSGPAVGDARGPGSALDVGLSAAALAGVTPPSLAITLFGRSATRFLQLELSALETSGRGRVVSRPRVVTADKIQAVIEQGTELPYQTRSGRRSVTSIQFRKATLRLEVTPLITPDGRVILDVDVRKDSVGQAVAEGFAVDTRHVKTQVQVENGGTVAIGGIYQEERRDNRASVPWLGDVPVLGALFRNRANEDRRTELLVFLTPSVVPEGNAGGEGQGAAERLEEASARPSASLEPVRAPALEPGPAPPQDDLPLGHRRLIGVFHEATRSARPTQIPVSSGIGTQISAIYAGKRNTCRTDGGGQDHGWTRSGTTSWTAVL